MDSNTVIKIKKLLALAQSSNPHERDAAMAKALALAHEAEIDLALLDTSDVGVLKDEGFTQGDVGTPVIFRVECRFAYAILAEFFRVEGVRGYKTLTFIGRKSDVEFARWLYPYLVEQFRTRWDYYRRTELTQFPGLSASRFRNTYMFGMNSGLVERLTEERQAVETRRFSDGGAAGLRDRYALAVQDEEQRRQQAVRTFYPHLRSGRSYSVGCRSRGVLEAGEAAGRTISLNRPLPA